MNIDRPRSRSIIATLGAAQRRLRPTSRSFVRYAAACKSCLLVMVSNDRIRGSAGHEGHRRVDTSPLHETARSLSANPYVVNTAATLACCGHLARDRVAQRGHASVGMDLQPSEIDLKVLR